MEFTVDMEEIKQHIELLANGSPSGIVAEMRSTLEDIQKVCETFPNVKEEMGVVLEKTSQQIEDIIQQADDLVLPLELLEKNIEQIESKPGIQRYYRLLEEITMPDTRPAQVPALRREVQSLKAAFKKELAEMVNKNHKVISERLNLIQHWKSVNLAEIRFLEQLLEQSISYLLKDAHQEGNEALVETLNAKLADLKQQAATYSSSTKRSVLQISNIQYLKESMRMQLKETVRLEKIIIQKYQEIHHLTQIQQEMNSQLPGAPSIPDLPLSPQADRGKKTTTTPASRMVTIERNR